MTSEARVMPKMAVMCISEPLVATLLNVIGAVVWVGVAGGS